MIFKLITSVSDSGFYVINPVHDLLHLTFQYQWSVIEFGVVNIFKLVFLFLPIYIAAERANITNLIPLNDALWTVGILAAS